MHELSVCTKSTPQLSRNTSTVQRWVFFWRDLPGIWIKGLHWERIDSEERIFNKTAQRKKQTKNGRVHTLIHVIEKWATETSHFTFQIRLGFGKLRQGYWTSCQNWEWQFYRRWWVPPWPSFTTLILRKSNLGEKEEAEGWRELWRLAFSGEYPLRRERGQKYSPVLLSGTHLCHTEHAIGDIFMTFTAALETLPYHLVQYF